MIKSISGPINFVNRADEDLQRRWEVAGPEIAEYLEDVEKEMFGMDEVCSLFHNDDSPSHNAMFRKDYSTIIFRLIPVNPFMEEHFVKVGTNVRFTKDDYVRKIPDIGQIRCEEFVETRLTKCQKLVSDSIEKNEFTTPSKSIKKKAEIHSSVLTDTELNRLRAVVDHCPSDSEKLFAFEFTGFPEALTKDQKCNMDKYHSR